MERQPESSNTGNQQNQDGAPERLVRDLAALADAGPAVPASLDDHILAAARSHLSMPRRRSSPLLRVAPWVGVAALFVLAATTSRFFFQAANEPSLSGAPTGAGGVETPEHAASLERVALHELADGGPIDILPAFALARELDAGRTPSLQWGANGDHVVDRSDVESLALRATALASAGEEAEVSIEPNEPTPTRRFLQVKVMIDPHGRPLAAYQFHLVAHAPAPGSPAPGTSGGRARIVGVENGEAEPFRGAPPYYDRKAVEAGRSDHVTIAMFSNAAPATLPRSKTRVASVHMMIEGDGEPVFDVKVDVATEPDGHRIAATASVEVQKAD